jgi:DNA-binding response OmpR family regulator
MTAERAHVLIVDDDPAIREIVATILRRELIQSDLATDGEDAIAHLDAHTYHAVVLDLLMPRVDGAAVIRHMRAKNILTPVIVISAVAETDDLDPDIVRVTMKKPIELQDLRDVVGAVLRTTRNG